MTSMNENFMIHIRLKEAIAAVHRIYLNVSGRPVESVKYFSTCLYRGKCMSDVCRPRTTLNKTPVRI